MFGASSRAKMGCERLALLAQLCRICTGTGMRREPVSCAELLLVWGWSAA